LLRVKADLASFAAIKEYPRRPLALYYKSRRRREDGTIGIYLKKRSRADILRDRQSSLDAGLGNPRKVREHYDRLLRIADDYNARCQVVRDRFGATALEEAAMKLWGQYHKALDRFVATPPTTIRGLMLKMREVKTWNDIGTSDTLDAMINGLAALDPDKLAAG
jgi:hypothetical protein